MAKALLSLLIEFDDQVRRDHDQSPVFLHRRDRKFALASAAAGQKPGPRQWLDHLHALSPPAPAQTPASPLARWYTLALTFALAGAVMGVLTMLGLLYYNGGQQINVTVVLAFIALQLLLALLTTLQSLLGWRPWGRLANWMNQRWPQTPARPALTGLQPSLMACCAHLGGLMFGLTGFLTLLSLVVVQDLAFGWSSTLNASAEAYHYVVQLISLPWHSLWPAAVPSAELVQDSRFFRMATDSGIAPARWGDWWPFLAMAWLCYVVVPRLVLLAVARIQLHLKARTALNRHPGLAALLYRMETPALETGNGHDDAADNPDLRTRTRVQPLPVSAVVVHWADDTEMATAPSGHPVKTTGLSLRAGGSATLAQDRQTLEQARLTLDSERTPAVSIVTQAWQPPTGELADFLTDARHSWPDNTVIALVPMGPDMSGADPSQLAQWQRFVDRLQAPAIRLCQPDPAPSDQGMMLPEARHD